MLADGINTTLKIGAVPPAKVEFAFVGLPAYGEDSRLLGQLEAAPAPPLVPGRYRCGNDAICGWAGALAGEDGINLVSGTGSIAYGQHAGRAARAGGWGELFSDEGSAFWIAREGLSLFSRMSDGRSAHGPWYDLLRGHFKLRTDLDLCAAIYGDGQGGRSHIATLAPLVARAARAGDAEAVALFTRAADELAGIVHAVYDQLDVPAGESIGVSYSGGMFNEVELLREPFLANLNRDSRRYRVVTPRLPPVAGAALYAAKLSGSPLDARAIQHLEQSLARQPQLQVS